MKNVLDTRNITKTFQEGREPVPVLRGVSVAVAAGEIVVLAGPSGSGKTTYLSIAGCILTPTSGRVVVAGEEVDIRHPERLADIRKRSIGFVFQQYNLFPALTALENVLYAMKVKGLTGAAARREAEAVLDLVGLGDRKHFLPRDLSGGQKQRVALARALAGSPPLLLADEPTANLDTQIGGQVIELFRQSAKQQHRGVLIVTHDPKVHTIADRVLHIRDGMIQDQEAAAAAAAAAGVVIPSESAVNHSADEPRDPSFRSPDHPIARSTDFLKPNLEAAS